jgi:hypothetical protein
MSLRCRLSDTPDTKPGLWSRIALQALAIIVLREGGGVGGMGRHLGGFRLDGSSQRGIAFYAVTGKGGGNEFHQIFHRGS